MKIKLVKKNFKLCIFTLSLWTKAIGLYLNLEGEIEISTVKFNDVIDHCYSKLIHAHKNFNSLF